MVTKLLGCCLYQINQFIHGGYCSYVFHVSEGCLDRLGHVLILVGYFFGLSNFKDNFQWLCFPKET